MCGFKLRCVFAHEKARRDGVASGYRSRFNRLMLVELREQVFDGVALGAELLESRLDFLFCELVVLPTLLN